MRNPFRPPSLRSLIAPRPVRKATNVPSVRGLTAKSARRTAGTITR